MIFWYNIIETDRDMWFLEVASTTCRQVNFGLALPVAEHAELRQFHHRGHAHRALAVAPVIPNVFHRVADWWSHVEHTRSHMVILSSVHCNATFARTAAAFRAWKLLRWLVLRNVVKSTFVGRGSQQIHLYGLITDNYVHITAFLAFFQMPRTLFEPQEFIFPPKSN